LKRLAIIPARGGSKRLPNKNKLLLGGIPLIVHTINAVASSGCFEKIIFSSDDDQLLQFASKNKELSLEKREASLATDKVKVIDLVKQIAGRKEYDDYDQVGLFLPTCPFRNAIHIKEGITLLGKDDFSVVSICEMNDPLQLSLTIDSETKVINPESVISPSPLVTGKTRSQDFSNFYRVNGGFYISWLNKFRKKENFFQGQVKGYLMDRINSLDIDSKFDFEIAQFVFEKFLKNEKNT
jgi:N-acylneuraminate cytidylyltransferase/CMP-N,N'-diacetyllegionaminic acid synthase